MATQQPANALLIVLLGGTLAVSGGCVGYRAGAGTLYAADVQTVYVPMIESRSFRRDLGERLTEAVVREIELKTPYKVVATPNADSLLEVRLLTDSRRTLAEDGFDNPRVQENQLRAEVLWTNRRRAAMAPVATALPMDPVLGGVVGIAQATPLIPEAGQTIVSQQQLAITRLAEQIVATMEEPW
ncbi:LPS assembly lipoprotein LptE [Botrimarina hoheduenensis]|uniref:Lipopolysaccharide-assembly n=1 Tax=Botrimarina hoheduenensis TaxID=2528000 RepID=A0A5C5WBD4_9BACT|nr:LPS assembly lipoprotein LptE [Botrimarina hoheduenensis]TWT47321.1 hypothetical protein Pla111_09340 [Botrimarina hoheduenensis]